MTASVVGSVFDVDAVYETAKSLNISSLSPSSGDLLIAWISLQAPVTITSVTGSGTWTELYSAPDTDMGSGVYYKISDGTETTITWNVSANSPASKGCLKITGHDATTPIEGSNKQYNTDVAYGGTNSYTASATGLALALICIDRNQQNFGDPSSFSNSFTGQGGSSDASNTYTRVYYASKAYTSGSQSTTYTGTGAESNVGYLVLVQDAGGGGTTVTLSPDVLTYTESTLSIQADVDTNVSINADALTYTESTLGVQADVDTTVTITPDALTYTESTLGVQIGTTVTLIPDALTYTESTLTVQANTDTTVTLIPDALTYTESTLSIQADVDSNITVIPDALTYTESTLSVSVISGELVTIIPDALTYTESTLGIQADVDTNVTISPDALTYSENVLSITSATTTTAAAAGGGVGRRKQRQFLNLDGKLIEVASYQEAVKLYQHLNKTVKKPKVRKLKLKVKTGPYVTIFDDPEKPMQVKEVRKILNTNDDELMLLLLMAA